MKQEMKPIWKEEVPTNERLKEDIERIIEDIPSGKKLTKRQMNKLAQEKPLLQSQKEVLREWYDTLRLGRRTVFSKDYVQRGPKAQSFRTFKHYLLVLAKYGKFIQKPFIEATKRDIEQYQVFLEKDCTLRTLSDYLYIIKLFYIWLYRTEEIPEVVEDIRKYKAPLKQIKPEEVILPSEIKKLVKACERDRDKGLVSLTFESQGRVGEIINARIKDFIKFENYAKIRLRGKTGERLLAITDSVPYIEKHLNTHPFRDDPEAPLFISISPNNYGGRLTTRGVASVLRTIAKRIDFKKRFNPHWFRHSGLDWVSRHHHFNERDLRIRAGWSKNSKMPQVYQHYEEDELNDKYLMKKGVKVTSEHRKEERQLVPVICPRCERENPSDARYCNCGQILDSKELMRIEKLRKESSEFSDKLMKTPLHQDVNMGKGVYEAVFENMTKNPIMMDEFKKLVDKMKNEE